MQIFRGEGEVSDVYVSHKRRRFNNSKFGFVRFKKLEEATNAINKLNGLWIRGRRIMVAFAKYGRKRVFQNGSAIVETDKKEELIGDGMISTSGARDRRSFNEVVEGRLQHPKLDDGNTRNSSEVEAANAGEFSKQLDKMKIKELVWRVFEGIFNANNLEEFKRHLRTLLEGVISDIKVESPCYRNGDGNRRKEGEAEQGGVWKRIWFLR